MYGLLTLLGLEGGHGQSVNDFDHLGRDSIIS